MRRLIYYIATILSGLIVISLSSCEHAVQVKSVVHEDGSIDRSVILLKADSNAVEDNMFGIRAAQGWDVSVDADTSTKENKKMIVFQKHFASCDEVNTLMDSDMDTLFRIQSSFEKQFRWFYTYMTYADTYRAINRFSTPDIADFFTAEDFSFIDRLPAEGQPITHADSIYLSRLNEKIYDIYAARGYYDLYYEAMMEAARKSAWEPKWLDTLSRHRENLFRYLMEHDNDFDENFMVKFVDSLKLPVSPQLVEEYEKLKAPVDAKIGFMSVAGEGEYAHSIEVPWTVIRTNADSVSGNTLYWNPPVVRFLLRDYTMYAEARRMNYWAVAVSGAVVIITMLLLFRRRSS